MAPAALLLPVSTSATGKGPHVGDSRQRVAPAPVVAPVLPRDQRGIGAGIQASGAQARAPAPQPRDPRLKPFEHARHYFKIAATHTDGVHFMTAAEHGYDFYSVSAMEAIIAKMCAGAVFYLIQGAKLLGIYVSAISNGGSSEASGEPAATMPAARHAVGANIAGDKTAEAKTGGLVNVLKRGARTTAMQTRMASWSYGVETPMMHPEVADVKIMELTHDKLMAKAKPFGLNPPSWKPVPKEQLAAPMPEVRSLAEARAVEAANTAAGHGTAFVMHGPQLMSETRSALERERCNAASSGIVFVLVLMAESDYRAFSSPEWKSLEGEDEHAQLVAAMRCHGRHDIVPVVSVRGGFIAADSVGAAGIRDIPVQLMKAARMHRAGSDHVVRLAAAARAEAEAEALAAEARDEAGAAALEAASRVEAEEAVFAVLTAGAESAAEALAAPQAEEDERVQSLLGWESAVLVSSR